MRLGGHVAHVEVSRSAYRVLAGKPEGNRLFGRRRLRREDDIKIDLQELGWGGTMDWIYLARDRDKWRTVVIAVMNLRVP